LVAQNACVSAQVDPACGWLTAHTASKPCGSSHICSGGSLFDFLSTDCGSDWFNHSAFAWSSDCTGGSIYESEKPLGCWLSASWGAVVAANGVPGELSRLAIKAGDHYVNFTLNGLLCMNVWFDLTQDHPASSLVRSFNIDSDWPGCTTAPPDLSQMGGGTMLMALAAKLNVLRDVVLQDGECAQS